MSVPELTDLLSRLPGRRVLVVGDVMLDDYLWGDVRRVCPEAPVPVVEVQRRTALPGGAGNAAANVARLAGAACLAAVVGADRAADDLRSVLSRAGVDPAGVRTDPARPTTTKQRIMARNHQVLRIDAEDTSPLPPDVAEALWSGVRARLDGVDAVLLSDYGKGVVSAALAQRLLAAARQAGVPVVVDPKGPDYARYRGAALLKPNLGELEAFCRRPLPDAVSLSRAGERLAADLGGTAVLVTRGADGMSLFASGRPSRHVSAAPVRRVYDVTGAGDTVAAVLALGLAGGGSLEAAVRLANVAAGLVVGKAGTAVVDREELAEALGHGPVPDFTT
jgi:D-glycero-beta-D-manno-heptose-7-phosphate kinase